MSQSLPLYSDGKKKTGGGCTGWIASTFHDIWATYESRNIFLFLMVNLSFAFVELTWGYWTNSLGLITDSFHMFFDCTALVAGLVASLIARRQSNDQYRYGYGRAQIIGGFVNALFLVFVAIFIVTEGVERFMDPPEVHTEMLLEVSVAGLLVNILGIFAFQHAHTHGGEACDHGHSHAAPEPTKSDHGDHGHSHASHGNSHASHGNSHENHGHSHGGNGTCGHAHEAPGLGSDKSGNNGHAHAENNHGHSHGNHSAIDVGATPAAHQIKGEQRSMVLDGVMLHVMADTLGSVSVIISSLLIHAYGWMVADPICSLFTAFLILVSVYPLLTSSTGVLMQRTPAKLEPFLPGCFQKISAISGVVEYREPRFWTLSGNDWHGTVTLVVRSHADSFAIRAQANKILFEVGVNKMVIQVEAF